MSQMGQMSIENTVNQRLQAAQSLHTRIMATGAMVAQGMVEFSRMLLEMQTKRLYEELGYKDFGNYVEEMVGIKQRQAYTYISNYRKLGPQMIEQNASLGVTKLDLLTQISAPDRAEFLDENDVQDMSVPELKAKIDEINGLTEQISLLQTEKTDAETQEAMYKKAAEERAREAEQLRAELEQIKSNTDGVTAEEFAQGVADAVNAERAIQAAKLAQAEEAAASKAKREAQQDFEKQSAEIAERATEAAKAEMIKAQQDALAEAQQKEAEAIARAEKLARQMEVQPDKETTAFALYFEQLQTCVMKMQEQAKILREQGRTEQADKLTGALVRGLESITDSVRG